jgi:GNAT superfamily N-acetyltransferase
MLEIRLQIEKGFGDFSHAAVAEMVLQIRKCQESLNGQWYLALDSFQKRVVGEIGMVRFHVGLTIARLQDVDIIPSEQGRGLGNELLLGIIAQAKKDGISALCLKADHDDWPLNWYHRRGFEKVGEWFS